ncbi:PilZ domain-containing protein [Spiribacter halobius]|uniref:PilZ domain-containing protein n=1 Tax=Sediminicurvatus halobius TaxID=2182432 RepID=A0A2U2N432_9GAMM|nr:PilZ domain-containing protein [Spiribacter halobius]PWG63946.1 hypothetical protein DEM34_07055 [Spiribacter halobius]UEX76361.1 PilZ domain-containing protein [Spiribacter halobius]
MTTPEDETGRDRRQRYRVSDWALVDLAPVSGDELEAIRERLRLAWPDAFSLSAQFHEMRQEQVVLRRHAERESATFARLMEGLERRLDRLAEILMVHEFGECPPPLEVDVSAEGMGLHWPRPLAEGQALRLRMLFPSTGAGLHTLAHVAWREVAGGGTRVGLTFEFLHERQEELMVHHVMQREAMLLRERSDSRPSGK